QRDGTNLLEGVANFTGTTSPMLTNSAVGPQDALDVAHGYACVVSGTCSPATNSSKVSLVVDPLAVGGTAAALRPPVSSGTGRSISLEGQTGNIVNWQSSLDGGATWLDVGSTNNPLFTAPLSVVTAFRAVVASGSCRAATSSVAAVTLESAPLIT